MVIIDIKVCVFKMKETRVFRISNVQFRIWGAVIIRTLIFTFTIQRSAMTHLKKLLLVCLSLSLVVPACAQNSVPPELAKKIDSLFTQWDKPNTPGFAL